MVEGLDDSEQQDHKSASTNLASSSLTESSQDSRKEQERSQGLQPNQKQAYDNNKQQQLQAATSNERAMRGDPINKIAKIVHKGKKKTKKIMHKTAHKLSHKAHVNFHKTVHSIHG